MPSATEELTFDAETHTYRIGKKRIPSVSEILKKTRQSKDFEGIDPFYANRGTATHLAIRYWLEGRLDESSLDSVVKPHFDAFLAYWRSRSEQVVAIEKPMADLPGSFAGTPDLITGRGIYDWKCSKSHDPVAELQGQAYKILAMANGYPVLPFVVVELHDDGTFAEFDYGDGIEEWSAVMELYRWRTKKR